MPAADGTPCDDGNPCTKTDICQAGVCGGTPVTCAAGDECHDAPQCNPMTGMCEGKPLPDGVSCDDKNPCTQTDACQTGVCVGKNPIPCMAKDECHVAGTCEAATGQCGDPPAPNGTACSAGFCVDGVCTPPGGTGGGGAGGSGGGTTTTTTTSGAGGETSTTGGDPVQTGGCGCGVASSTEGGAGIFLLGLVFAARRRRR
ncbi:MAG: MYXO-CTERM sorting domain-containing protein [Byssovorax sp.]